MVQTILFIASVAGLALLALQLAAVRRHVRTPLPAINPRGARRQPGISILKPLCGVDDRLAENLAAFAQLPYPRFELILGVGSMDDPAYPLARAAEARWPGRVKVVVQRGAPGLNPKVNQLIGMARHAREDILLVSDSNVTPLPGYLEELAACFADPDVGLVTNAIVTDGEAALGSICDGLHMTCAAAPGMIAGQRVLGLDLVVGKSMALRAADLARLGGFWAVKDVLAEDYVMGQRVTSELKKRVVMARTPIVQVTVGRGVREFVARHTRWNIMRRKCVALPVYAGELLLNPTPVAVAGLLFAPSLAALAALAAVVAAKAAVDHACARALRPTPLGMLRLAASPLKDLLVAFVWASALVRDTIVWRDGRRMRVLRGTRLEPVLPAIVPAW